MKNTLSGPEAYDKLTDADAGLLEHTHTDIMHQIRKEVLAAGHYVTSEIYRCNNTGEKILAVFLLDTVKEDVQLQLMFTNDYTDGKTRFTVGGKTGHRVMLTGKDEDTSIRYNPGSVKALLQAEGDKILDELIADKERLSKTFPNFAERDHLIMTLFLHGIFTHDDLDTFATYVGAKETRTAWEMYEMVQDIIWQFTPIDEYLGKLNMVTGFVHEKLRATPSAVAPEPAPVEQPAQPAPAAEIDYRSRITELWDFKWYKNGDYASVADAIDSHGYSHLPWGSRGVVEGYRNTVTGDIYIGVGEHGSNEYQWVFNENDPLAAVDGPDGLPVPETQTVVQTAPAVIPATKTTPTLATWTPNGEKNTPWVFYWNQAVHPTVKKAIHAARIPHECSQYYCDLNTGNVYRGIKRNTGDENTRGRQYELSHTI